MNYRLVIKPLAEKDIAEIYSWYNQEQEGLGDSFVDQVERSLEFIVKNPEQYQIRYKEVRMVKIARFPICLHFTVEEDKIFVHAALGTSRNPQLWKKRTE